MDDEIEVKNIKRSNEIESTNLTISKTYYEALRKVEIFINICSGRPLYLE